MASGQKGDLGKQGQGGRGRGLFHAAGEGGDRGKSVAWGAASVIHRAFVRFHVSAAATFCSFPCFFPPFFNIVLTNSKCCLVVLVFYFR